VTALAEHAPADLALPDVRVRQATAGWLLAFEANTRRAYEYDLTQWLRFCANHDQNPLTARRGHVDAWARTMTASGLAPRTVARRLSSIASWYRYLVYEDTITGSPCEHVRRPRIPDEGVTPGMTPGQTRALLAAADGPRAVALLTLLAETGIRINEALSADVESIGHDRNHRILRITRKGGTTGRTILTPRASRALDDYLAGRTSGPLFITSTGRRMQQSEAWRLVRRTARRAGLEVASEVCTHSLRVAFITTALDENVSLRDVQDAAGHKDPRTTRRYDRGRHSLDRHAAYAVSRALAGGQQ
jgi:integrase/recombinase XerD